MGQRRKVVGRYIRYIPHHKNWHVHKKGTCLKENFMFIFQPLIFRGCISFWGEYILWQKHPPLEEKTVFSCSIAIGSFPEPKWEWITSDHILGETCKRPVTKTPSFPTHGCYCFQRSELQGLLLLKHHSQDHHNCSHSQILQEDVGRTRWTRILALSWIS